MKEFQLDGRWDPAEIVCHATGTKFYATRSNLLNATRSNLLSSTRPILRQSTRSILYHATRSILYRTTRAILHHTRSILFNATKRTTNIHVPYYLPTNNDSTLPLPKHPNTPPIPHNQRKRRRNVRNNVNGRFRTSSISSQRPSFPHLPSRILPPKILT